MELSDFAIIKLVPFVREITTYQDKEKDQN